MSDDIVATVVVDLVPGIGVGVPALDTHDHILNTSTENYHLPYLGDSPGDSPGSLLVVLLERERVEHVHHDSSRVLGQEFQCQGITFTPSLAWPSWPLGKMTFRHFTYLGTGGPVLQFGDTLEAAPSSQIVIVLRPLIHHHSLGGAQEGLQLEVSTARVQREESGSVGHLDLDHGQLLLDAGLLSGHGDGGDSRLQEDDPFKEVTLTLAKLLI